MKKAVPEWLNSSLWYTPLPHSTAPDDLAHRYSSSNPYIDDDVDPPATPPPQPQPPPAPATTRRQVHDGEASRLGDYDHDDEVPSAEEISRQALLLTEEVIVKLVGSIVIGTTWVYVVSDHASQLSKKIINIGELRRLASLGVPDNAGVRPTVWKLLLGYLPLERGLWASELVKKRFQYKNLRTELLMNPGLHSLISSHSKLVEGLDLCNCMMKFVLFFKQDEITWFLSLKARKSEITRRLEESVCSDSKEPKGQPSGMLKRSQIAHGEHPLSIGKSSIWNKFFQEAEILEQIDRDVKRTHPDIIFFSGDSAYAKSNQDALRNILIIFSKLNPGIRYVQGMNEVLAPLFYVFKKDPDEENAAAAEADTFFCFTELMSAFRDNFCQQLDNSNMGIRSTIARLSQLLKEHDEELWRHLEVTTKVNPQFYAFRWITLLLTMEFNFFDILRIWDTLLSDPEGPQETLLRVCCAMLILVRRHLIAGDFTSNLKLLQHYPPTNINHLIYVASKLRTKPLI